MNFGKMLDQMFQLRQYAKKLGISDDELAKIEFIKQDQMGSNSLVGELTYTIIDTGNKKYIVKEPVIKKM